MRVGYGVCVLLSSVRAGTNIPCVGTDWLGVVRVRLSEGRLGVDRVSSCSVEFSEALIYLALGRVGHLQARHGSSSNHIHVELG